MSQKSRPIADISNVGWTPVPLYPQINEVNPDVTSFVSSGANPAGDNFTVRLQALAYPRAGDQTLKVLVCKTTSDMASVSIFLLQGDTVIARKDDTVGTAFGYVSIVLNEAQKRLITNYANLRVAVFAWSSGLGTPCCANALPAPPSSLKATITIDAGGMPYCSCLDGLVVPLTFNPFSGKWEGAAVKPSSTCTGPSIGICGIPPYLSTIRLSFYCLATGTTCSSFRLDHDYCRGYFDTDDAGVCVCDPLSVQFHTIGFLNCCCGGPGGTPVGVTVTL